MLGLSGLAFGLVAGYLTWRAVRGGRVGTESAIRTSAPIVGVVAGAVMMAVSSAGGEMVLMYILGVGVGLWLSTIARHLSRPVQSLRQRRMQKRQRRENVREAAARAEIDAIESDWPAIERLIQSKLGRLYRSVQVQELPELRVSYGARVYAMRKFAQEHGNEGVILDTVGGLFGFPVLRQRPDDVGPPEAVRLGGGDEISPTGRAEPALARYSTTYVLGDDRYDRSFVVENRNGEFIGECGVGVWETIGAGSPKRVTAFEVWLFDKEDMRTVTVVLMSDYAFYGSSLRPKAALTSDVVLVEEGKDISLDTETLLLRARVSEAVYGEGKYPQASFFEALTVELEVWRSQSTGPDNEISPSEMSRMA